MNLVVREARATKEETAGTVGTGWLAGEAALLNQRSVMGSYSSGLLFGIRSACSRSIRSFDDCAKWVLPRIPT